MKASARFTAETAAQMLIVVAAVIVIDMVSARLRKALV